MNKDTKKSNKTWRIIVISLITIMALPPILLSFNKIQNFIVDKIVNVLEDKLQTHVAIGDFDFRFPLNFNLKNVEMDDKSAMRILNIEEIEVDMALLPLFKGNIELKSAEITQPYIYVSIDTSGVSNVQFLLDAFKTDKKSKIPNIVCNNIAITNATVAFKDFRNGSHTTSQTFSPKDIYANNLNTHVSFSILEEKNIDLIIHDFNCTEQSGLQIDQIATQVSIADNILLLPHLNIALPNSQLSINRTNIKLLRNDENKISNAEVDFYLDTLQIYVPDMAPFHTDLKKLKNYVGASGHLNGNLNELRASDLSMSLGNNISLSADINGYHLQTPSDTHYECNINHIKFNYAGLNEIVAALGKPGSTLPKELRQLGNCNYNGKITGNPSNVVLYGNLGTNIGSIRTDLAVQMSNHYKTYTLNGRVSTQKLEMDVILPESGLGMIAFKSNSKVTISSSKKFNADVKVKFDNLAYKGYNYKNVDINGHVDPQLFNGNISLDDPNGQLKFVGELSHIDNYGKAVFNLDVRDFNFNKLNLSKNYPELALSFSTNANFEGEDINTMTGYINIDSLLIVNANKEFAMDRLNINASEEGVQSISITSDIINGGITGNYSPAQLYRQMLHTLSADLPYLKKFITAPISPNHNNMTLSLSIEPLKPLADVLDIPWHTTEHTTITGHYNHQNNEVFGSVSIPRISNGKLDIDSVSLFLHNNDGISLTTRLATDLRNGHLNARARIKAKQDIITANLSWGNNRPEKLFAGEIFASSRLKQLDDNQDYSVETTVIPTEIILNNRSWNIDKSVISLNKNHIDINRFEILGEDGQYIKIDGRASNDTTDIITASLNSISLDYISELLPDQSSLSFGGEVSGNATVSHLFSKEPRLNAEVVSEQFQFNKAHFGRAHATCYFDIPTTSLQFDGKITADSRDTIAHLYGGYYIKNDSLDILGRADSLDIRFLDYYLAEIFGRVKGLAYGDVHIHGFTKAKTVAVDVAAYAKNASITVDFLNTEYFFSDSVYVNKERIEFGTIDVFDREGHRGILKGGVNHKYFKEAMVDISFSLDNMMAMNTTKELSESFYGKIYASGDLTIKNINPETIKISCKGTTNRDTRLVIPIDSYDAGENQFITFVSTTEKEKKERNPEEEMTTNVLLDLMVDATPDAEILLIIDSKSGDMLRASGNGNLRLTYDINADDMKLYGTYHPERGSYLFTFQNIIRKEFHIKEGSSIAWTGDLLNASINIDAYHQLTADLAEVLNEAVLSNTTRTSVPVQCLLNLSGQLTQPVIKFNLLLPNSDEELNRALSNAVSTEEQMNRQIIALLLMGKFLNSESMRNNGNIVSQNELYSVVSSTLSSQLNNWASQMFNNWDFGVNFRTSGEGDTRSNEYEFNFLYTPTSKILINGNVGYRDDAFSSNRFIGDFDFEYKLIQSGKLRLKAYTHTNDYREFKKSLTTQGLGLVYSESFYDGKDLIESWKKNIKENKEDRKRAKAIRKERKAAKKAAKE